MGELPGLLPGDSQNFLAPMRGGKSARQLAKPVFCVPTSWPMLKLGLGVKLIKAKASMNTAEPGNPPLILRSPSCIPPDSYSLRN